MKKLNKKLLGLAGIVGISLITLGSTFASQGYMYGEEDRYGEGIEMNKDRLEFIKNNDYEAFKDSLGDDRISELIDTEEKFEKLVAIHQARESGDMETVKELSDELGLSQRKNKFNNIKTSIKYGKEIMQENKSNLIEDNKQRRLNIKGNRINFREEYKDEAEEAFSELSDEVKEKLKDLRDTHMQKIEEIKEKMKEDNLSLEQREELKNEINEINDQFNEDVKELVGENETAKEFIEKREELKNKNDELRNETREARREYKQDYKELVQKYKNAFIKRLTNVLPKLSVEKLEKVSEKIEEMILKVEENESLSDDKKEKSLSQLIGLKETLDEELESREEFDEDLYLDEIIDEVLN